jgi:hypothetical protein
MTLDSSNVYWTSGNAGVVMKCPLTGCGSTPTYLASGQDPTGIAVYSDRLYWSNTGADVLWCPVSGCPTDGGLSYPTTFANSAGVPTGIAVNISGVFWTVENNEPAVDRCLLTGCFATSDAGLRAAQIVTAQEPDFIAVDPTKVYWADELSGSQYVIHDCFLDGCDFAPDGGYIEPVIATQGGQVQGLAVDNSGVYWIYYGSTYPSKDGIVMTCPTSGCPTGEDGGSEPTVLASGQAGPYAIALDSTSAYWVNAASPDASDGTVMRVAK